MTTRISIWYYQFIISILITSVKPSCINTDHCKCISAPDKNDYYSCGKSLDESSINVTIKSINDYERIKNVEITCKNNYEESDYVKWIAKIKLSSLSIDLIERMIITGCPLPNSSFAEIINVFDIKNITEFQLTDAKPLAGSQALILKPDHFANLSSIRSVVLRNNNIEELPEQLFKDMSNLKILQLIGPRLRNLPEKIFEPLKNLDKLVINESSLTKLPDGIFQHQSMLRTLSLNRNKLDNLSESIFSSLTNLEVLDLSNNNLSSLPKNIFQFNSNNNAQNNLMTLLLNENQLSELDDDLFHGLSNLTNLFLGSNRLTAVKEELFKGLEKLKELDLSNNHLKMNTTVQYSPMKKCKSLSKLHLKNTTLNKVYLDWREEFNLNELDLSFNNLQHLEPEDFNFTTLSKTIINFSNNNITRIDLNGTEKWNNPPKTFNINNNPIICDCHALPLVEHVQRGASNIEIIADNTNCNAPSSLKNTSMKNVTVMELKCPLHDIYPQEKDSCPENCTCNYRSKGTVIEVNCTSIGMEKIPEKIPNIDQNLELLFDGNNLVSVDGLRNISEKVANRVVTLSLSNNKLQQIDGIESLKGLKVLRLSNNNLTQLNDSIFEHLNSLKNLTMITLDNNPLECDCNHTKSLLDFVQNHYDTINHGDIRCSNNHTMASLVELCETNSIWKTVTIIILIAAIFIGIAITACYLRIRKKAKLKYGSHRPIPMTAH